MPAKAKGKSAVFEQAGMEPSKALRPDEIARIELLRIIYQPGKDAETLIALAVKLERYVSTGAA